MMYASETWEDVEREFDKLGRDNFEECGVGGGVWKYDLSHEILRELSKSGNVHVTTIRDKGVLVGYVLSVLTKRHIQYNASVSQVIGMYLKPEHRKGLNGMRLMKCDEINMKRLGVQEMNGGFTMSKDLLTLFKRRKWSPMEISMRKCI